MTMNNNITILLHDFTPNEIQIILALSCRKWLTFREIVKRSRLPEGSVTVSLSRLAKRGIVKVMKFGDVSLYRLTFCVDDDSEEDSEGFFTKLVNALCNYLVELSERTKGTVVTFTTFRFLRWLESNNPKLRQEVKTGKYCQIIIHILKDTARKCPDCFYMIKETRMAQRFVIYKNKIGKIIELLKSILTE